MVRFKKSAVMACSSCVAIALLTSTALVTSSALAQNQNQFLGQSLVQNLSDNQAQLDRYLLEIEKLISENDLEGARDKLTEAQTANFRDESLDVVQGQLRLLESLNENSNPSIAAAADGNNGLTERDRTAATDLLDSLRVAMENGALDKVRLLTDPTPKTNTLLDAVFEQYAAVRVAVSAPEADELTQTFLATLEIKELTTRDGDTAFPAQAWKTHRLRIIKSQGSWQKVLW